MRNGATAIGSIGRGYLRPHGFGKCLDDCQAQPCATAAIRALHPHKGIKSALAVRRKSRPFVLDEINTSIGQGLQNSDGPPHTE